MSDTAIRELRRLVLFAGVDVDSRLNYGRLAEAGLDPVKRFDLADVQDPSILVHALEGAWGVVAGGEAMSRAVIEQVPSLKVIVRPGLGYDRVDIDAATDHGVLVATTPGTIEATVADLTIGLMLATCRRLLEADRAVRNGRWRAKPVLTADLTGSTVSLIGLGRIGRLVAQRLVGFDVNLVAVDIDPDHEFIRELGIRLVDLDEALAAGDFVSLHVPLNAQTNALIGPSELARMKRGAFLINTARGELVDERALFQAIQGGQLAGAGLDAFAAEPLPSSSPLLSLTNVVLSGHVGWATYRATLAMYTAALNDACEAATGQIPDNALNPEAWNHR